MRIKKYTSESANGSIQRPLVYKSPNDNWLRLIQTPHSSYHFTTMSKIASGPLLLRFAIVKDETGELFDLLLTSNGVGNVVTVEPEIFQIPPSGRQIVRLDIISVCIIDSLHYSGML